MTEREYRKYNNPNAFDLRGKLIKPGDIVVFNNNYNSIPRIGKVSHFTESGNVIIHYNWGWNYNSNSRFIKCRAIRPPEKLVKISNGRKVINKN